MKNKIYIFSIIALFLFVGLVSALDCYVSADYNETNCYSNSTWGFDCFNDIHQSFNLTNNCNDTYLQSNFDGVAFQMSTGGNGKHLFGNGFIISNSWVDVPYNTYRNIKIENVTFYNTPIRLYNGILNFRVNNCTFHDNNNLYESIFRREGIAELDEFILTNSVFYISKSMDSYIIGIRDTDFGCNVNGYTNNEAWYISNNNFYNLNPNKRLDIIGNENCLDTQFFHDLQFRNNILDGVTLIGGLGVTAFNGNTYIEDNSFSNTPLFNEYYTNSIIQYNRNNKTNTRWIIISNYEDAEFIAYNNILENGSRGLFYISVRDDFKRSYYKIDIQHNQVYNSYGGFAITSPAENFSMIDNVIESYHVGIDIEYVDAYPKENSIISQNYIINTENTSQDYYAVILVSSEIVFSNNEVTNVNNISPYQSAYTLMDGWNTLFESNYISGIFDINVTNCPYLNYNNENVVFENNHFGLNCPEGCDYLNPICSSGYECIENNCNLIYVAPPISGDIVIDIINRPEHYTQIIITMFIVGLVFVIFGIITSQFKRE